MKTITEKIFENADSKYAEFSYKLIPTIDKRLILGLRAPMAREIAKKYAMTPEGVEFINSLPHKYHDENMVHAYMLGYKKGDITGELVSLLSYVDNWAVCDSLAASVKPLFRDRAKMLPYIKEWLSSDHTYKIRFGLVCLLNYYVDEEYIDTALALSAKIKSDEYYINMANAWLISVCLVKEYERTVPLIEEGVLDIWTHNKAIQKAIESYRISKEKKDYLRSLKRK